MSGRWEGAGGDWEGRRGSYISDLQVMDDGVLGGIEIIRVDDLEQEDGLHKCTLPIHLRGVIQAVGGQHPHSVALWVSRASRCCHAQVVLCTHAHPTTDTSHWLTEQRIGTDRVKGQSG